MYRSMCTHHHHTHGGQHLVLEAFAQLLYGKIAGDGIEDLSDGFAMAYHLISGLCNPVLCTRSTTCSK